MKKIIYRVFFLFTILAIFPGCCINSKVSAGSFYEYGIDVSSFQGDIDWRNLREETENLSFCIIRGGTTNRSDIEYQEDACFEQNYTGAIENGFKVGLIFTAVHLRRMSFMNASIIF